MVAAPVPTHPERSAMVDHRTRAVPTAPTAGPSPGHPRPHRSPHRSPRRPLGRPSVGFAAVAAAALLATLSACGPAEQAPASGGTDATEQAGTPAAPGDAAYAPSPGERAEIVAAVQAVFDALETGDGELLRSVLAPDVVMHWAESRDGETVFATADLDALVARVEGQTGVLERMWEPRVRVEGALATLWAPYDFYAGGELSHCGIDAATLLRREDGWRIVALSWTREQPPACELHPDGPPPGAGGDG